ncbi:MULTISPECIES: hypothetical protein [Brevibacillus]|jgi:hypothetical protein|uniref:Uncharacterized protein n=1 Tax=Brevibacillus borstelensis AK1 TaxID=1300222 RepID=M8DIL7_9BACL|nr:hypothetical protein [Brevibacillus borstelensis]EMT53277.1 hypothetical protein I532_10877 [Brevibacillus borstelensis AK1]KKX55340.1 hypothetical protein X546_06505 [Brevibacillus borstelensis cifa_chp40]MBE5394806.1 hypothetical protein [Brevibacillus borstelensis]MED1873994.1 hypothetical protein [Brevibacillus borstelensis]MED1885779.1 hypothetical protein [Brevibacillus borstelensis]
MARLEYRLLDEEKDYPVLYYYDGIDKDEISLRFACDYLVKGHVVFEKTSCATEPGCYVIYVRYSAEEQAVDYVDTAAARWGSIQIELREYKEGTNVYPLIHTYSFKDDDDVLLLLQSDYITLNGREWEKTSAEVDEDRRVYVYYARPSA